MNTVSLLSTVIESFSSQNVVPRTMKFTKPNDHNILNVKFNSHLTKCDRDKRDSLV